MVASPLRFAFICMIPFNLWFFYSFKEPENRFLIVLMLVVGIASIYEIYQERQKEKFLEKAIDWVDYG